MILPVLTAVIIWWLLLKHPASRGTWLARARRAARLARSARRLARRADRDLVEACAAFTGAVASGAGALGAPWWVEAAGVFLVGRAALRLARTSRRLAWLRANPGLAWCLLAGPAHRRQLRFALAARRHAAGTAADPAALAAGHLPPAPAPPSPAALPGQWSLRETRLRLGVSIFVLDAPAGLPPGTVHAIETGRQRVRVATARTLETALRAMAARAACIGGGPESPVRAHYYAAAGWTWYVTGSGGGNYGTGLWFGPPDPACRCHACTACRCHTCQV